MMPIPGESRGTGRLARAIAGSLHPFGTVAGVTRHQLLVHPDIPYTSHNSCAVIHLETTNGVLIPKLVQEVGRMILDDFIQGSDPGLAAAPVSAVGAEVMLFGQEAKQRVLLQGKTFSLAERMEIPLVGLGGSKDGIIGALAGLGLAASGNNGGYVLKGRLREFVREARVDDLRLAGVNEVHTTGGENIRSGIVHPKKFPKPSLRNHRAVLFVEEGDGCYHDVVMD